jgi:hypothetical protein
VPVGHRVGVDHRHRIDVRSCCEEQVDRPAQRAALAGGVGLLSLHHADTTRCGDRRGLVGAVVGDDDDFVATARVVLVAERSEAPRDVVGLVVRGNEDDDAEVSVRRLA